VPQPPAPARPLTIAHRAANRLSTLAQAFAVGVDYAEADVWLYRGRLEVRHEKTAGLLPVLWDRWLLKPIWAPRLIFDDLLAAAAGRGKLFLDLKGRAEDLAEAVAGAVERAGAVDTVAFSGGWAHLDRLSKLLPQVPRFYTVGSRRRLTALRPRLERGELAAVSIDSRILTVKIVSELRGTGVVAIITWAVETPAAARRLLAWGVSGVSSDSLTLLAAIRNGQLCAPSG
jgi:glycerophosphoryl diester phosphodiesterase